MLEIEPPDQFKDDAIDDERNRERDQRRERDRDRKRRRDSIRKRSVVQFSTQFVDRLVREVLLSSSQMLNAGQRQQQESSQNSSLQYKNHLLERQKSNDVFEKKSTLLNKEKQKSSKNKKSLEMDAEAAATATTTATNDPSTGNAISNDAITVKDCNNNTNSSNICSNYHNNPLQMMFRSKKPKYQNDPKISAKICDETKTSSTAIATANTNPNHIKKKMRAIRQIFNNLKSLSCRTVTSTSSNQCSPLSPLPPPPLSFSSSSVASSSSVFHNRQLLEPDTAKANDEFQFHEITPVNQWNRLAVAVPQPPSVPNPISARDFVDNIDRQQAGGGAQSADDDSDNEASDRAFGYTTIRKANFDITANIEKVKECGYYWGSISCKIAEKLLKYEPEGSFLLRDSNDDHYIFSITIKFNNYVRHVRISYEEGTFSFGHLTKFKSETIVDFIQSAINHSRSGKYLFFVHRRPMAGPVRVQLLHPISRFKHVQSLQHICRFHIVKNVRKDLINKLPLPKSILDYLNENQYYDDKMEQQFN